eukprot:15640378-Heterocapsa_arctica.AAC.1
MAAPILLGWPQETPTENSREPLPCWRQLQDLIKRAVDITHGKPLTEPAYDSVTGIQTMVWKWGTTTQWKHSRDNNVMFIRYFMLCLNGDMVPLIPPQLIVSPSDIASLRTLTLTDVGNPWLRMAAFIQEVLEPQLDDAGKEEAKSFRDLL